MPRVKFSELPGQSRVWVFASDRQLRGDEAKMLLDEVDRFLDEWRAHGQPLRNARDWRDDRFLAIGVDPTAEQASGCSIDGLFRALQSFEKTLNASLVGGGRVFYRDATGDAQLAARKDIPDLVRIGALSEDTPVFDTTVTDASAWRDRFVRPAKETWVASLVSPAVAQDSQRSSRSATNASSVRNG
jgi:hypothetical protein